MREYYFETDFAPVALSGAFVKEAAATYPGSRVAWRRPLCGGRAIRVTIPAWDDVLHSRITRFAAMGGCQLAALSDLP